MSEQFSQRRDHNGDDSACIYWYGTRTGLDQHRCKICRAPTAMTGLPLWRREPMLDKKGSPILCDHRGCGRWAVRIVSYEAPKHKEFRGQTHDCCSAHSRAPKAVSS